MNPIVVIYVSGGVVQGVRSNVPDVGIEIFDVDNKKEEGQTGDEIDAQWTKVEAQFPHPIF